MTSKRRVIQRCLTLGTILTSDWLNMRPVRSVAEIGGTCLDGHSPGGSLLNAAIGHKLLQLQGPSTNETEGWANRGGAVHRPLPQHTQGVGVVERDPALVEIQTHPEARGQRDGEGVARGVGYPLVGQENLAHAHGEEAEWRGTVLGVLCPAIVPTVWVISTGSQRDQKDTNID